MDNEEEFNNFINKEIATMDILLTAKAARTSISVDEFINLSLAQGISKEVLYASLLRDLEEGGRIFGEFRNAIRATSNGFVNRVRDVSAYATLGTDTIYRWIAVLVNTCPDCLERHNQLKTWGDWQLEGLPRTGQTVCKENCKCILLPELNTEVEPIMREKK